MTIITVIAAVDVCRMLAHRRDAVMTGSASANDLTMIHRVSGHPDI